MGSTPVSDYIILLSRTSPDASWAHGRRKFYVLADVAKAPIAVEAVRQIDVLFDIKPHNPDKRS